MRNPQLLILCFAISACERTPTLEAVAPPVEHASANASVACPSQEFSRFAEAFSESQEIQMAFTEYPLEMQQLDTQAMPEPKPFTSRLQRHQIEFPIIPNKAKRMAKALRLRVEQLEPGRAKLTLMQDDSDYLVEYFFRRDACWKLVSVDNQSL